MADFAILSNGRFINRDLIFSAGVRKLGNEPNYSYLAQFDAANGDSYESVVHKTEEAAWNEVKTVLLFKPIACEYTVHEAMSDDQKRAAFERFMRRHQDKTAPDK